MQPPLLSLTELGLLLTKCQPLLDYAKAAEEYALSQALSGEKIEGWKLVEGRSRRVWDDQEKASADLKHRRSARRDALAQRAVHFGADRKTDGKERF